MSDGARARLGEAENEEGEESEETEVATALAGVPEALEAANIAHSNQPLVSQADPNFLKMMEMVELANGFNPTSPIFPMKILPTSSIIGSYLKLNNSLCLVIPMKSLMSRIRDWGERAYINVYRRGLASRLLDQSAFYPGNFDTLKELMKITLELDTGYHERQKEKGSHQEKKPPVTGSNSSRPPQYSF
ncbi:hypothetical protein O181_087482 [Austropuccinia psidii MF-1]|uniref:Uncharacterized protein n=1 Tax=Austropuccinia psidii MF-1 TaxID=1389203 RepID=A0A9Q3IPR2_9BASI|nr:hypothetical protein [Austropuccinia psidii MF-1]